MISAVRPPRRHAFLYPGEEVKPSRAPKLRLHGATKHAVETGRMRLLVTASLFGFAFAVVGLRLVDLMVINDKPVTANAPAHGLARAPTARADILDRNGVLIATNLPTVNLYADSKKVLDAKQAADKLVATLPDLKRDEVYKHLTSGRRFIYLRRDLTPNDQMAVNALGIPGVYFENSERRAYLHGSLFSHVVGNTDPDNKGVAGVEKSFDETLTAQHAPVALSLDVRVQHAVRESLAASIARFQAKAGSGVVMDTHTGEILAMVSLPDYDPKDMGTASPDARFNRATLGVYEMGSTFKLFTAAMTLDAGTANLVSRYDASQPIKIGRFQVGDYHGLNRVVTLPEIMIHSSNLGAAKMALEAGTAVQQDYLRRFGLLSPLRLEMPETGKPIFPDAKQWRDASTITIAYGHGISVTPVQVASAVSAVVNGGMMVPATIVRRAPGEQPAGQRVIAEKTSETMRALMRLIVLYGSGKQADVPGYLIGGKTGSADKPGGRRGYSKTAQITSFVAAFPIEAPRYVVLIILDEPRGTKETYNFRTAGWNAAPTVASVVGKIAPMLGVYPMGHEDSFQPLVGLMATYGPLEGDKSDYGAPVIMKASAPVTNVAMPVSVQDESTEMAISRAVPIDPQSGTIGDLIDDAATQDLGGVGAAE